jgi:hypothetical protein
MNGLLLDTHILVWLLEGNERLGQEARRQGGFPAGLASLVLNEGGV